MAMCAAHAWICSSSRHGCHLAMTSLTGGTCRFCAVVYNMLAAGSLIAQARLDAALACCSLRLIPACLAMSTICAGVRLLNMLCMLAIMLGSLIMADMSGKPPGPILHSLSLSISHHVRFQMCSAKLQLASKEHSHAGYQEHFVQVLTGQDHLAMRSVLSSVTHMITHSRQCSTYPPGWPELLPMAMRRMFSICSGGMFDIMFMACFTKSGLFCTPHAGSDGRATCSWLNHASLSLP